MTTCTKENTHTWDLLRSPTWAPYTLLCCPTTKWTLRPFFKARNCPWWKECGIDTQSKKLYAWFVLVFFLSFSFLGWEKLFGLVVGEPRSHYDATIFYNKKIELPLMRPKYFGGGEGGSECEWVSHSGCGFVSVRKCHVIIMWNSNPDIVEIPKLDATEDQGMIFTHTCLYSCCCCCWGEVVGSCSIIARLLAGCRINNPSR